MGSVLEARLRRETRKSRLLIKNARQSLAGYDEQKLAEQQNYKVAKIMTAGTASEQNDKSEPGADSDASDANLSPADEISGWLKQQGEFEPRYCRTKLGVLESKVSKFAEKFDPISALDDEFFEYSGGKDKEGECDGVGVLEYEEGSYLTGCWHHGRREGHFRLETQHPRAEVYHLEGDYRGDELCGRARLQLRDETWQEGWFKDSVLHGFSRKFDKNKQLTWVGMFRNGKPFGVCWLLMPGGGCVVGPVNEEGALTGDNIAYIYPDFHTAFLGQFTEGQLVRAVRATVTGVRDQYSCIKVPQFTTHDEEVLYHREVSTCHFITTSPMLRDPYEVSMVEVRQSMVEGAEEGLFSRKNVEAGAVLAFYNGIRREKPEDSNYTWGEEENAYKIFDPTNKGGVVDIPGHFRSLTNYCASLAHKTNHSFIPNCEFGEFHHPRFGLVPCLQAIHSIAAGEEIFVWYGYELDYCPAWYMDAWARGQYFYRISESWFHLFYFSGDFAVPDSMKTEYGVN